MGGGRDKVGKEGRGQAVMMEFLKNLFLVYSKLYMLIG